VTKGVYAYLRHPSYFGWGLWAISTQVILCNPVSMVAYAFASYSFFAGRIPYEEYQLYKFFGKEYEDYAKRVPIRIPFIKSYFDQRAKQD
jgi:protein-S-isoprenylcysteine O-methyltransferase